MRMLIKKIQAAGAFFAAVCAVVFSEETVCTINGRKAINVVNEKFLSITIDPAILLTGLNIR